MKLIRRRLLALALMFVVFQLAGMAATPAALWQIPATDSGSSGVACTCNHGPNAECPMHKHQKPASSSGGRSTESRWCKGCQDSVDVILTTLFAWAGPAGVAGPLIAPDLTVAPLPVFGERALILVRAPFSPPPRG